MYLLLCYDIQNGNCSLLFSWQLEEEISTLRTVLGAKVYQATELKKKLGITPMVEIKQDLKDGFQNIKESEALVQRPSFTDCLHVSPLITDTCFNFQELDV